MKTKWIAAILSVCLLMSAALMLSSCDNGIVTSTYDDANKYRAGAFTYSATTVKSITVEWYSGAITVVEGENSTLSVSESGEALDEAHQLHYFLREDGALFIRFWESGLRDKIDEAQKHLTVEIPQNVDVTLLSTTADIDLHDLQTARALVTSHSGNINIAAMTAKSLDVSSTSGEVSLSNVTTAEAITVTGISGDVAANAVSGKSITVNTTSGKVAIDELNMTDKGRIATVSGDITVHGAKTHSMEVHTTSGKTELALSAYDTVVVDATSGEVYLTLPEGVGTTVYLKTVSGSLHTEKEHTSALHNGYHFGTGEKVVRVETVSGSLHID
ncbi:MAG: DUF4097 family beta strand repeat protein [Clostridia bacterium]|nr:DUF4097 family beta strand repeat protein [Clostridia bacterium]